MKRSKVPGVCVGRAPESIFLRYMAPNPPVYFPPEALVCPGAGRLRRKSESGNPERPEPEEMFERLMDSRFGAAPTLARNESKTLIESMAELGLEFEPAPGEHQRDGIDQVNDLLYYDAEKPIGPANKPRLLILETCKNVIWALENWTGRDGPQGACKAFIDLLRYRALNPRVYFPPEALVCRGGRGVLGAGQWRACQRHPVELLFKPM